MSKASINSKNQPSRFGHSEHGSQPRHPRAKASSITYDNSLNMSSKRRQPEEPKPCTRCIENAKKRENLEKKKKEVVKGNYLSMNFDEIERQLRMLKEDPHNCDDFGYLNKMNPADANFRDKRLGRILDNYNDDVGRR